MTGAFTRKAGTVTQARMTLPAPYSNGTRRLKAIATDVHFWVPVAVLLIGLTLLIVLR